MPEPGQADRSTEPPRVRHQDSSSIVLRLLSLQHCRKTEPRAASESHDPLRYYCFAVGSRPAEEAPGLPRLLIIQFHRFCEPCCRFRTTRRLIPRFPCSIRSLRQQIGIRRRLWNTCKHLRRLLASLRFSSASPSRIVYSHPRPESLAVPCEEIESPR